MTLVTRKYVHPAKPHKLKKIENEEWREVAGSNGLYQISNYGRVKSFQVNKTDGQIINGTLLKGYRRIQLVINGKAKRVLVHILVAEAWIKKPSDDCIQVIHKDWNKKNNHVSNLAWMTKKDTYKRMFDLFRENNKTKVKKIIRNSKLQESDVKFMKTLIERGTAQNVIAKMFCISPTQVKRITRGENWGDVKPDK